MIKLNNISKQYGDRRAINSVNLDCEAGSTTVLIGPSGSGKSTILRTMIGLVIPESGEVLIDGDKLGNNNLREHRTKMGYVIQEGGLFPHLTASWKYLIHMARNLRWDDERINERTKELCRLTKFPHDPLTR